VVNTGGAIRPRPPHAPLALPWDDAGAPPPVDALDAARRTLGDTFTVTSGETAYFFVFSPAGLRAFYDIAERDASKGLADYRMLARKLPNEVFTDRRTFAHDLFAAGAVEGYLDNVDWAIATVLDGLGHSGVLDVFSLARRIGHTVGIACWFGREAPIDVLVAELDALDGADAFVAPHTMGAVDFAAERAALARIVELVGALLDQPRAPSFLDDVAVRWSLLPGASFDPRIPQSHDALVVGVAYDLVLLHVATMTNLFAALGWTIAQVALHDVPVARTGDAALEAIRLGQRSIMLREVLRPITFDAGDRVYEIDAGVQLATMLPLTNLADGRDAFDLERASRDRASNDPTITTFGHGSHRCPAQRFSLQTITRAVNRLRADFALTPRFDRVDAPPMQIGGVGRAALPCPLAYERRA
jgi:cytochrome P450